MELYNCIQLSLKVLTAMYNNCIAIEQVPGAWTYVLLNNDNNIYNNNNNNNNNNNSNTQLVTRHKSFNSKMMNHRLLYIYTYIMTLPYAAK